MISDVIFSGGTGNRTFVVNSQAEMLALPANVGDIAVRLDLPATFILQTFPPSIITNWVQFPVAGDLVTSVFGRIGNVVAVSGDYTTDLVTEGANLYFTDARAVVAIENNNGLTFANGLIKLNNIGDLSNVKGVSFYSNNDNYKIGFDDVGGTVGYLRYNIDQPVTTHGHIFSAGVIGSASQLLLIRGDGNVSFGTKSAPEANIDLDRDILFNQTVTPSNPSNGLKLYAKNDDKLYTLDQLGNEREIIREGYPFVTSVFGRVGDVVAVSGDYTTDLVTEGANLYFTDARALSAVEKVNNTIGFTLQGGTVTPRLLTVTESVDFDQNLSRSSSVTHAEMTISAGAPYLLFRDISDSAKRLEIELNHIANEAIISAYNVGVGSYQLKLNPSGNYVGVGYPVGVAIPMVYSGQAPIFATYSGLANYTIFESASSQDVITNLYRSPRYNVSLGSDRTNSMFEIGLYQNPAGNEINDRFFIGRSGLSSFDFSIYRNGNIGIGDGIAKDNKLYVNGDIFSANEVLLGEITTPSTPVNSGALYSKSDGKLYYLDKAAVEHDILAGANLVTSVFGRIGDVVAVSGDYTTDLVTEGANLYFTDARALSAVEKSNAATSFTITGGTVTPKVLTVNADCTVDQNLTQGSNVQFLRSTVNSLAILTSGGIASPPPSGISFGYVTTNGRVTGTLANSDILDFDVTTGKLARMSDLDPPLTLNRSNNVVFCNTTSGQQTVSWDPAVINGKIITIKLEIGGNNVILSPTSGLIEGLATYPITTTANALTITSDGTNSFLIGQYTRSDEVILTDLANYTVKAQDKLILCDASLNPITISWDQSLLMGRQVSVKIISPGNTVTLAPTSGAIEGLLSTDLTSNFEVATFMSDGFDSYLLHRGVP